jgi:hypothetical protein
MSEIVIEHFSKVVEPDLYFDRNYYTVKGDRYEKDSDDVYINLTDEELKNGYHINYFTFRKFFELLRRVENPNIIETGTSCWSTTASSKLFDTYINKYGGTFNTVDIVHYTIARAKTELSNPASAHLGDSVEFIKNINYKVDAAYLDSYDIDWLNYEPAAQHGKREFEALLPKLNDKAIVLIDDTPSHPTFLPFRGDTYETVKDLHEITDIMPGKGMYAIEVLNENKDKYTWTTVLHQYQLLLSIERVSK